MKIEPFLILMLSPPPKESTNFSLKDKASSGLKLCMWQKMRNWKCGDLGSVIPGHAQEWVVTQRWKAVPSPALVYFGPAYLEQSPREVPWHLEGCMFLSHDCKCQTYCDTGLWCSFRRAWRLACLTAASHFGHDSLNACVCVTLSLCELFSSFVLRRYMIVDTKRLLHLFYFYILCNSSSLFCTHLN